MKQLTGHDASFLYLESPTQPMHIGAITIYDPSTAPGGKVRFKDILSHIEGRLDLADLFRKKLARVPLSLDHPWWVDDPDFDIEFHIRHIALPEPGDWRQLCIQAARLHSRPLDPSRPLWEFTVIEGLDDVAGVPKGSFAIVSKIHHACLDGVSGDALTAAIHDLEPEPRELDAATDWRPEATPRQTELVARAAVNNTVQPLRFARLVGRTVPAVGRAMSVLGGGTPRPVVRPGAAPRTVFNGTVSAHRVFESISMPLDRLKAIRRLVDGATINDVFLAIVGSAMRSYLQDHTGLPEESLTVMAPISVRTGKGDEGANRVSAMFASLATDVDDPLARLEAVHASTAASKTLTDAVGADLLADYALFTPSMLAGAGARLAGRMGLANVGRPAYNTVVSNVPGPQVPLYMHGARVVAMHGLAPIHDGVGLFHGVYSYCGQVHLSATACRTMLPDPAAYAAALRAGFDELDALA